MTEEMMEFFSSNDSQFVVNKPVEGEDNSSNEEGQNGESNEDSDQSFEENGESTPTNIIISNNQTSSGQPVVNVGPPNTIIPPNQPQPNPPPSPTPMPAPPQQCSGVISAQGVCVVVQNPDVPICTEGTVLSASGVCVLVDTPVDEGSNNDPEDEGNSNQPPNNPPTNDGGQTPPGGGSDDPNPNPVTVEQIIASLRGSIDSAESLIDGKTSIIEVALLNEFNEALIIANNVVNATSSTFTVQEIETIQSALFGIMEEVEAYLDSYAIAKNKYDKYSSEILGLIEYNDQNYYYSSLRYTEEFIVNYSDFIPVYLTDLNQYNNAVEHFISIIEEEIEYYKLEANYLLAVNYFEEIVSNITTDVGYLKADATHLLNYGGFDPVVESRINTKIAVNFPRDLMLLEISMYFDEFYTDLWPLLSERKTQYMNDIDNSIKFIEELMETRTPNPDDLNTFYNLKATFEAIVDPYDLSITLDYLDNIIIELGNVADRISSIGSS